jgi:hypothetical protein
MVQMCFTHWITKDKWLNGPTLMVNKDVDVDDEVLTPVGHPEHRSQGLGTYHSPLGKSQKNLPALNCT